MIIKQIKDIPRAAIYEQLAEEAAELAKAALKYARILRAENPTPIEPTEAFKAVEEEYSDVVLLTRVLHISPKERIISDKMERWNKRLNENILRKDKDMGKCIVLTGAMASGKTSLAWFLEQEGIKRVTTYTTRPKRIGEKDGVDYHYISEEEFLGLKKKHFFAETTHYDTVFGRWYYGSAKEDYRSNDDTVIVLNPRGVMCLAEEAFVVLIDLPEEILVRRALLRGDTPEEITRRIIADKLDFQKLKGNHLYDKLILEERPIKILAKEIIQDSQNLQVL